MSSKQAWTYNVSCSKCGLSMQITQSQYFSGICSRCYTNISDLKTPTTLKDGTSTNPSDWRPSDNSFKGWKQPTNSGFKGWK